MLHYIYEIDDLRKLRECLFGVCDREKIREYLFGELMKYVRYCNAEEWNRAVRLCECLSIVGWGEREPVEAIRSVYFNGNPNTFFVNSNGEPRFLDAVWSKRKDGMAIDFGLSTFHKSPELPTLEYISPEYVIGEIQAVNLNSQRTWIPKNPIFITRGLANCYENSKSMINSLENDLKPLLNKRMRPDLYGNAINRIIINCSFSFYDNYHCKTNYIIADDSLKLKQSDFYPMLLTMFTEKEIEDNGYFLRNRFSYGPFKSDTGTARIAIVFEKEFSEQSPFRQKQVLSEYLLHAVSRCAKRLCKKIDYDFELMISDLSAVLHDWSEMEIK